MLNLKQMSNDARNVAIEMAQKFPQFSVNEIKALAKFVVASAAAIKECEKTLAPIGQTLSAKGYEMVFSEMGKECLSSLEKKEAE